MGVVWPSAMTIVDYYHDDDDDIILLYFYFFSHKITFINHQVIDKKQNKSRQGERKREYE